MHFKGNTTDVVVIVVVVVLLFWQMPFSYAIESDSGSLDSILCPPATERYKLIIKKNVTPQNAYLRHVTYGLHTLLVSSPRVS